MTYSEAVDFLYNSTPLFQNSGAAAYKPGLASTALLSSYFGNPHYGLPCMIIGGTNGKGSTSHTLSAILQSAGYKVGLFTSPHLVDFRERIRIDGKPVPEETVVGFVDEFCKSDEMRALSPSFFELTTIMALKWFKESKVDIAILEVGLGGRLDCTNICDPMLSVITNISLDHTDLLGKTEAVIAREKSGIMRPGRICVIGKAEGEVKAVFEDEAEKRGAILKIVEIPGYERVIRTSGKIVYESSVFGNFEADLQGDCQFENTATILETVAQLRKFMPGISNESIAEGFSKVCSLTGLRGRWETVQVEPFTIICDTGHNIGGWKWLGPKLSSIPNLKMVVGFVNDKDVDSIMQQMPRHAEYFFATPSVRRGRPAEETAAIAHRHGLEGRAFDTVCDAVNAAKEGAKEGDTIFIGGSTFVVADFLRGI